MAGIAFYIRYFVFGFFFFSVPNEAIDRISISNVELFLSLLWKANNTDVLIFGYVRYVNFVGNILPKYFLRSKNIHWNKISEFIQKWNFHVFFYLPDPFFWPNERMNELKLKKIGTPFSIFPVLQVNLAKKVKHRTANGLNINFLY